MSNKKMIDLGYYLITNINKNGWEDYDPNDDDCEDEEKKEILKGSDIVLQQGTYTIKITYPLSVEVTTKITGSFTRKQLAQEIAKIYDAIYVDESRSSSIPEQNIPGMLNRVQTNGKYGIWGHDISDLILHTAYLLGDNTIELGVDS